MPKTNLKIYFLSLLPVLILSSIVWAQGRSYTVQIASAPSEAEANSIVANLKSKGINAYWTKAEVPGKGTRYRVRIGKYKTQAEAKAMADKVVSRNLITEFIITTYEIPVGGPGASDSVVRNEKKNNPESNPPAVNIVKTEPPKPETAKPEKPKSVEETPQGKERAKAQSPEPPTVTPTRETSGTKPKDSSKDIVKSAPAQSDLASNNDKAPRTPIGPPAAKPERKPEQKVDAPIPVEPKAETSEPVIATPAVADALVDFSISNDNWKIVRRSAETDKNLRSIYFVDAMTGWAAGDAGSAYRTTDGGRSWKPLLSGAPANINFIHFADWNNGWMLGETSSPGDESETILFITTNGGKTWTRKSMPNLLSLHFIDPKNGWAVGKNATLLKTNDGGNQWTKVDSMEKLIGLPVESTSYNYGFRDIQFIDPLHGWLIGNFYGRARDNIGGIFMTTDGGTTWQRVPVTIQTQHTSGRFTPGQYHSVKFSDLNTGSITGEMYDGEGRYFFVLHTRDGGKTWEQFRTPSRATHSTQFLDLANGWMAAFAPREGGAEAVVYDTTLMRTDNGGMSWRNDFIAKGRRIRSVFFLSPTKGWAVGDRGMILRYDEKTKVN